MNGLPRTFGRPVVVAVVIGAFAAFLTVPGAGAASGGAAQKPGPLSPRLAHLADPKVAGLPRLGQNQRLGLPAAGEGSLLRDGSGKILVNVRTTPGAALADTAREAHAHVIAHRSGVATFAIAPSDLNRLGSAPGVVSVSEVLTPMTSAGARVRAAGLNGPTTSATCPSGVVSQGDAQLRAAIARSTYSVDGAGIKIGVLSDSFNHLGGAAADVTAGDLPGPGNPCGHTTPVTVLSELNGGSDEGRAMLQIVHDLAPGAQLLFASAFKGDVDFANQIVALKNAGATVIVDDVSYLLEPMYQDGVIAAAINTVKAAGVSYFSSAANSTRTVSGKSIGSYEAPSYRATACPASVAALSLADCHDFNPGVGTDATDAVSIGNGGSIVIALGWSEPQFGVTTDIDFALVDNVTNAVVASGTSSSVASGIAGEGLGFQNTTGSTRSYSVVIGRFTGSGTPRIKWISSRSPFTAVEWNTTAGGDVMGPTIFGHNAALAAATIAAVPFNNSSIVEPFSSEGPAAFCWQPVNGTTPAAAKACATKNVDFAATDGVTTTVPPPLNPFYGTSAAAPHAAAVNALMRQARPCRTVDQLRAAEAASGRAVGTFGVGSVGSGLIAADAAIANLAPCGSQPEISIGDAAIVEGDSGSRSLRFAVTLSAAATGTVTVPYQTAGGDAVAGSDYTATSGTATIAVGTASTSVSVAVRGDTAVEGKELFGVWLGAPAGATIGRAVGLGRIMNDDVSTGLRVAVGDASVVEGDQGSRSLRFTISLSAMSASNVSVGYSTANDTATAGSDYTARSGTVTIVAGATSTTVIIAIRGDTTPEAAEAFKLSLASAVGAKIGRTTGIGKILTDD